MELKRVSYKHKNNKAAYYLINYIRQFIPSSFYQKKLAQKIHSKEQHSGIQKRVEYYNKLSNTITLKSPFNYLISKQSRDQKYISLICINTAGILIKN